MKFASKKTLLSLSILSAGAVLLDTQSVLAKEVSAGSSGYTLEEVIVTARKRGENLQDTPAAIAAFDAQSIEQSGIESMRDYAGLIPNVTLVETQNSGFAFINVRGLSQLRNTDPTVALVMDGVQSTSPIGFSQDLFDIEQIEFLKGPQGALYGRNSLGGAINIRTKQPTNEMEGMVKVSAGNGESYGAQGMLSGPIIKDKLLGRAAISYKDADGWRDNEYLNRPADPFEELSMRGKLLWHPSDNVTVDLRGSLSEAEGAAQQFVVNTPRFQISNPNSTVPPFLQVTGDTVFIVPEGSSPIADVLSDPNNVSTPVQGNILGLDVRDIYTASAKIDWETGAGTFTSITAYEYIDHNQGGEQNPYTSFAVEKGTNYRESESFSQEFRFTSPADNQFRWIAGAYLALTDIYRSNGRIADDTGRNFRESELPTDKPFRLGRNGDGINRTLLFNADDNDNKAYAVFIQASYDILDSLELTVAARYDWDKREQTVDTPDDYKISFVNLFQGDSRSADFSDFQPAVTLRYQPKENITMYASYSEGFRSGGFNSSGVEARAAALRAGGNLAVPAGIKDIYNQEETENYEIGFKYQSENHRLTINTAIFFTTITDQQLFNVVFDLNTAQLIRNIDEVEARGVEIDASFILTDGLVLTGGYGLTDTEIKKFNADPHTVGNKAPLNPEDTLNIGLRYNRDITLGNTNLFGYASVDYQRIGETWWEPANYASRDPVDLWNARVGIETADRNFGVALWVKNATDEDYFAEVTSPPGANYYAPLRKWGVELVKRF